MSKPLITVDVEAIAKDATKLMVERNIGALVVTEKREAVGMITERDILRNCCFNASCMNIKVRKIMSKPLVTVDGKTSIAQASLHLGGPVNSSTRAEEIAIKTLGGTEEDLADLQEAKKALKEED